MKDPVAPPHHDFDGALVAQVVSSKGQRFAATSPTHPETAYKVPVTRGVLSAQFLLDAVSMTTRTLFSFLALSSVIVGCAVDSDDSQVDSIEEVEPSEEGEESSDGVVESVEQAGMVEKCSLKVYLGGNHYLTNLDPVKWTTYIWTSGHVTCPNRRSLSLTACFERLQGSAWKKEKCQSFRIDKNKMNVNPNDGRYFYAIDSLSPRMKISKKGVHRAKFQVVESTTGYRWSKVSNKITIAPLQ